MLAINADVGGAWLGKNKEYELEKPRHPHWPVTPIGYIDPEDAKVVAELETMSPAPVLSTENAASYAKLLLDMVICYKPRDAMQKTLVRQIVDSTWEMSRYGRAKTGLIDRRFRKQKELVLQRQAALKKQAEARTQERSKHEQPPQTALDQYVELEEVVFSTVEDVDAILKRVPEERDHQRALEQGIKHHCELDQLLNSAIKRRNDAIKQYELYCERICTDYNRWEEHEKAQDKRREEIERYHRLDRIQRETMERQKEKQAQVERERREYRERKEKAKAAQEQQSEQQQCQEGQAQQQAPNGKLTADLHSVSMQQSTSPQQSSSAQLANSERLSNGQSVEGSDSVQQSNGHSDEGSDSVQQSDGHSVEDSDSMQQPESVEQPNRASVQQPESVEQPNRASVQQPNSAQQSKTAEQQQ
jgi:hypothetical protein